MLIFILLIIVCIFIFIYKKKSNNGYFKGKVSRNFLQQGDNYNQGILDKLIDPLLPKIIIEKDHNIFQHRTMVIKCIRAGIRGTKSHKMIILFRYIIILPGLLLGFFVAYLRDIIDPKMIAIYTLAGGVLAFYYPIIRLDSMIKNRQQEIRHAFPDFIDLMIVCVGAGMTAEQTYNRISNDLKSFSLAMASEIEILNGEITYFLDQKIAYDNFYFRTQNDYVRAFCSITLQSINYGTPLAQVLRYLSAEIREAYKGEIEKKAASLATKLTVPMMMFTLPVLFTVILYPGVQDIIAKFGM